MAQQMGFGQDFGPQVRFSTAGHVTRAGCRRPAKSQPGERPKRLSKDLIVRKML